MHERRRGFGKTADDSHAVAARDARRFGTRSLKSRRQGKTSMALCRGVRIAGRCIGNFIIARGRVDV
jgi:hypothetical protein